MTNTAARKTKVLLLIGIVFALALPAIAQEPAADRLSALEKQVAALAMAGQERNRKDAERDKRDASHDRLIEDILSRQLPPDPKRGGRKARDDYKAKCARQGLRYQGVLMVEQGDKVTPAVICT